MSMLRWFGLVVGLVTLIQVFRLFRQGKIRRFDFSLGLLFSIGLILVSGFPASVGLLRDMLALKRDQFSRLIAICIVSNLFLWVLLFYTRFRWSAYIGQFDQLIRELARETFGRQYPGGASLPSLVVIIPAYNEGENIGRVLEEMPQKVCGRELAVLVVDDGSQDNTGEVARAAGAMVVPNPINRGGGAALRVGFDIARQHGVEIVVTIDADGQHLPSEIGRLVEPILSREADFVIGSRILGRRDPDSSIRYIGIHVFNTVIRFLTSVRITDCSNGFRAFRVAELSRVLLRQDQFHTAELIIDAAKKGIKIGEVPVTVKRRESGDSRKGGTWSYGASFARTILKTWWR